MVRRGAGAGGAYLLRALAETKEKVAKGSCLFDRVANMDYSIVPRDDVPEGKVVVSLNPEDKQSVNEEDVLNRQVLKHFNSMKKKSKMDSLVDKSARVSVWGAATQVFLQAAGLAVNLKDPSRTVEKVIARIMWDDERKADKVDAKIKDQVEECEEVAQRINTKL